MSNIMLINSNLFRLHNSQIMSNIFANRRSIWGWLNSVFNKVDPSRIEEVGPDRAAAEWLLRCGASVKWINCERSVTDYNSLPVGDFHRYQIEEIDATDSAIMSIGFPHLKGLNHLRKFIIKNDGYIEDNAIGMLALCKNSLRHLEIISCIGVTDVGIISLQQLEKLQFLKIYDLPSVEDKDNCLKVLNNSLTNCQIDWKDSKPKTYFK